jgi:hypothetical protein
MEAGVAIVSQPLGALVSRATRLVSGVVAGERVKHLGGDCRGHYRVRGVVI